MTSESPALTRDYGLQHRVSDVRERVRASNGGSKAGFASVRTFTV